MIAQEDRFLMKRLIEAGVPKAQVAREFGVSRQAVYDLLKRPERSTRRERASKLDPFKEYIEGRLAKFDLPATVLLEEIRGKGYQGGITILKDFIREIRPNQAGVLTERFETLPGQQAQIDWGECGRIQVDGQQKRLYVFTFVLGFSRILFAQFTLGTRQPVLLEMLTQAFERWGVPEEVLLDNMPQAIKRHDNNGELIINPRFKEFCDHYGVRVVAARPGRARTKGKVERAISYLKKSFLTGRSFTTLEDLNQQLEAWLDNTANVRVHGTTGERPVDRYLREATALRRAAAVPRFQPAELLVRKVASDSHVRLSGVSYSVPPQFVGKTVQLRVISQAVGSKFEILKDGQVIARHRVPRESERRVTKEEHQREITRLARRSERPQRPRFEQLPPEGISRDLIPPVVQARSLSEYERLLQEAS
mgnify:FL=1